MYKIKKQIYLLFSIMCLLLILGGCSASSEEEVSAKGELENEITQQVVEELPRVETIKLSITGDIMFHGTQLKAAKNNQTGKYEFASVFDRVKPYFENADLALANFETVTAGEDQKYSGYPVFNTPENVLDTLKDIGIDVLTTANNHNLDKRKIGLVRTIDELDKRGISHTGTFKEGEKSLLIKEVDGIKLGIIAYTYGCNGMEQVLTTEELDQMVNLIDEDKIKQEIDDLKSEEVDYILAFMHWGNEYQRTQSNQQTELADKLIDWGVDAVMGSHPHVIQPSKIIEKDGEKKFIIYSMGNFVSNQRRETLNGSYAKYTEDGVIVELTLEKKFDENKTTLKKIDYTPTWVHRYKENGKYKYEIIPIKTGEIENYPENIQSKLIDSYNQTIKQMQIDA
jgi:poly-gamma-glutamate synthesis protein (capsule biosynthesis protein)